MLKMAPHHLSCFTIWERINYDRIFQFPFIFNRMWNMHLVFIWFLSITCRKFKWKYEEIEILNRRESYSNRYKFFHMNYCFFFFWQIKKENFPQKKGRKRVRTCSADYFFFTKVKEIRFRNMKFFLYIIALANEPKF